MRIGAAEAKCANPGDPPPVHAFPGHRLSRNHQLGRFRVDFRVQRSEIQVRRDQPMLDAQHRLDQPGHAGSGFQMTDIGFDRTDDQRHIPFCAQRRRQRLNFNRIAQWSAGAVSLHIGHQTRRNPGAGQSGANHRLLRRAVRRGQAVGTAILIHRRPMNDRQHPVAIGQRLRQPLQRHQSAPFAVTKPVSSDIECLATPIGSGRAELGAGDQRFGR
jgi:hypothetical protein